MSTLLKNRVQLIGHLGGQPEVKTVDSGTMLAKFSLATNDHYKKAQGEWTESTTWHQVTAWDKLAAHVAARLQKGSYVMVEGKLVTRKYTDGKGEAKYITEVRAVNVLSLDRSKTNDLSGVVEQAEAEADDLPF